MRIEGCEDFIDYTGRFAATVRGTFGPDASPGQMVVSLLSLIYEQQKTIDMLEAAVLGGGSES